MDTKIIDRMQALVNGSIDNDLNISIAEYILKNLRKVKNMTISDLAFETYTSTASISRFARSLGCKNFNEMKKALEYPKGNLDRNLLTQVEFMNFTQTNPFDEYIDRITASLTAMKELSLDDVDYLVKAIHDTENVYFYGISIPNLLAQNLQSNLLFSGKFVYNYDAGQLQLDAAKECPEDSLAIIFSMNGLFINSNKEIANTLRDRGIRQILVTQTNDIANKEDYERIIKIGNPDNTIVGRYKIELFMEILTNRYVYNYHGRDIQEALEAK